MDIPLPELIMPLVIIAFVVLPMLVYRILHQVIHQQRLLRAGKKSGKVM